MKPRKYRSLQPPSLAGYRQAYAFDMRSDSEIEVFLTRRRGDPRAGLLPAVPATILLDQEAGVLEDLEPAAGS